MSSGNSSGSTSDGGDAATRARAKADPQVARVVEGSYAHNSFVLATGHDLFSSAHVDVGTRRLLRSLRDLDAITGGSARAPGDPLRILDLGCGPGAIGVALATPRGAGNPACQEAVSLTLTDRDRLAVHVARLNLDLNRIPLERARVLDAAPGYAAVRRHDPDAAAPFHLIVSNVPARAGDAGLRELLFGADRWLAPGGLIAFVHVAGLTDTIEKLRAEADHGGVAFEERLVDAGADYTVRHWSFAAGQPTLERTDLDLPPSLLEIARAFRLLPWLRAGEPPVIEYAGIAAPLPHLAVHGVSEFDSPDRRTPLIAKLVKQVVPASPAGSDERILVFNPRHGSLPIRLAHERRPTSIAIIDRDTLATTTANANLTAALAHLGHADQVAITTPTPIPAHPWLPAPTPSASASESAKSAESAVAPNPSPDQSAYHIIAGIVRWREGIDALAATLRAYAAALVPERSGRIVLGLESGQLAGARDAAKAAGLRTGREIKRRGFAAMVVRRR